MGADLAVITSKAENQFITARLSGAETFVGLHRDPKDTKSWYWVDGSRPSYLNWDKGEPGNYRGREHCVCLVKSGLWHDTWCKGRIPSICEAVGKLMVIKYVVLIINFVLHTFNCIKKDSVKNKIPFTVMPWLNKIRKSHRNSFIHGQV